MSIFDDQTSLPALQEDISRMYTLSGDRDFAEVIHHAASGYPERVIHAWMLDNALTCTAHTGVLTDVNNSSHNSWA